MRVNRFVLSYFSEHFRLMFNTVGMDEQEIVCDIAPIVIMEAVILDIYSQLYSHLYRQYEGPDWKFDLEMVACKMAWFIEYILFIKIPFNHRIEFIQFIATLAVWDSHNILRLIRRNLPSKFSPLNAMELCPNLTNEMVKLIYPDNFITRVKKRSYRSYHITVNAVYAVNIDNADKETFQITVQPPHRIIQKYNLLLVLLPISSNKIAKYYKLTIYNIYTSKYILRKESCQSATLDGHLLIYADYQTITIMDVYTREILHTVSLETYVPPHLKINVVDLNVNYPGTVSVRCDGVNYVWDYLANTFINTATSTDLYCEIAPWCDHPAFEFSLSSYNSSLVDEIIHLDTLYDIPCQPTFFGFSGKDMVIFDYEDGIQHYLIPSVLPEEPSVTLIEKSLDLLTLVHTFTNGETTTSVVNPRVHRHMMKFGIPFEETTMEQVKYVKKGNFISVFLSSIFGK